MIHTDEYPQVNLGGEMVPWWQAHSELTAMARELGFSPGYSQTLAEQWILGAQAGGHMVGRPKA